MCKTGFIKIISLDIFSKVRLNQVVIMLTYTLQKNSSDPLYISLYKCLRNDIRSGVLHAGERLPSKRAFAVNLGISVITVENAYERLCDEGYVFSMPKRGYYVGDLKEIRQTHEVASEVKVIAKKDVSTGKLLADFSSNECDPEAFPFSVWSHLLRQVLNERRNQLLMNSPGSGLWELREAIAQHLKAYHGMEVLPEQVVIGAGTEYLMGRLIELLGFDLTYASEDPGYERIAWIFKSHGVKHLGISLDEFGLSERELELTDAQVVHISPSHQFPTGIVMPVSRRYELLGWASAKKGHYIIEDDYDSEYRITGRPLSTLQSIDAEGKVIYMNTFTKTLASTMRVSYMVLPLKLCASFEKKLSFYSCTVSNFEQYALAAFLKSGAFETHLNRMRRLLARKRDTLLSLIEKSKLNAKSMIENQSNGLHFLLRVDTEFSDDECVQRALSYGVKIVPLSKFRRLGKRDEHAFVIGYSAVKLDDMPQAVKALEHALLTPA
mgnify:CR=1 FL=1